MTVKEAIEKLKSYPEAAEILELKVSLTNEGDNPSKDAESK